MMGIVTIYQNNAAFTRVESLDPKAYFEVLSQIQKYALRF